jgi:hypothetical protein
MFNYIVYRRVTHGCSGQQPKQVSWLCVSVAQCDATGAKQGLCEVVQCSNDFPISLPLSHFLCTVLIYVDIDVDII